MQLRQLEIWNQKQGTDWQFEQTMRLCETSFNSCLRVCTRIHWIHPISEELHSEPMSTSWWRCRKARASAKSFGFILQGPWMQVQNFIARHQTVAETPQPGPKWCSQPTSMQMWLKKKGITAFDVDFWTLKLRPLVIKLSSIQLICIYWIKTRNAN